MMGGIALRALLTWWHLESGVQPPRIRSEQRLMKSVWRAECWKELQGRMSMWASLCPPVCPSTVSLPLDLPLRVLKRVTVWHHLKRRSTRHPQFFWPSQCRRLRRICISRTGFASVNGMQKRPGLEGRFTGRNFREKAKKKWFFFLISNLKKKSTDGEQNFQIEKKTATKNY